MARLLTRLVWGSTREISSAPPFLEVCVFLGGRSKSQITPN